MSRFVLYRFTIAACLLSLPGFLNAQEMRVYTTVRNLRGSAVSEDRAPVVARSLTLFHAGKVYDYVEAAKELTIFEPAHHRFTLLSERRRVATEVTQDEVRQFLNLVEQEGWKQLTTTTEQQDSPQGKSLMWLKFQLKPEFEVTFDGAKNVLSLTDRAARYHAELQAAPTKSAVESYLRFADATAELNSVLHTQAPLPRPRLVLNGALREHELLPIVVELKAQDDRLHLQARHEWTWKFQSRDRQLISGWESQLSDVGLRRITFRQYQLESMASEVSRNR